jgi:hypothetical protein
MFSAFAQDTPKSIPRESKVCIIPMEKNLDGFITAEIEKQKTACSDRP